VLSLYSTSDPGSIDEPYIHLDMPNGMDGVLDVVGSKYNGKGNRVTGKPTPAPGLSSCPS